MPFHQDCPYSSRRRPGEVNRHRQGQQRRRASCGAQGSRGGSSDGLCLAVTERRHSPAETAPALQETPGESHVPCPWHARLLQHRSQPGRHQRAECHSVGFNPFCGAPQRDGWKPGRGERGARAGGGVGSALPALAVLPRPFTGSSVPPPAPSDSLIPKTRPAHHHTASGTGSRACQGTRLPFALLSLLATDY